MKVKIGMFVLSSTNNFELLYQQCYTFQFDMSHVQIY